MMAGAGPRVECTAASTVREARERAVTRIIYMGTPEFAIPALEMLARRGDVNLALVVTQPDRPTGRGKKLTAPPIRQAADALGLPVLQVSTLRDVSAREQIRAVKPDMIVVAAFGMILGGWVLDLPPHGCVNLHASLLPRYRGANPIAAAIASGDHVAGVSLMQMDRGLDTGAVYAMEETPILPTETTESLTQKLAILGADLLDVNLDAIIVGARIARPQSGGATLARQMVKDDGRIDWSRSAALVDAHVRAMWPWPRAFSDTAEGLRVQVHRASVVPSGGGEPGVIRHEGQAVMVGCGEGAVRLEVVQLPGGKPVAGEAIRNLRGLEAGTVFERVAPGSRLPLVQPVSEATG